MFSILTGKVLIILEWTVLPKNRAVYSHFHIRPAHGVFFSMFASAGSRKEKASYPRPRPVRNAAAALKPLELVPIFSWLFLKGKCKGCGARISIRYPLTEITCALMYLWIYAVYGFSLETPALFFLMSVLFAAFFIDIDHMLIPDGLVITGLAGGILLYGYFILSQVLGIIGGPAYIFYDPVKWYTPLLGMASSSGFLLIVAIIGFLIYHGEGAMGMGDVKIYLPIGLFLGWKLSLLSLFGAFIIGGVAAPRHASFRI